jgi:hypothetical protein
VNAYFKDEPVGAQSLLAGLKSLKRRFLREVTPGICKTPERR